MASKDKIIIDVGLNMPQSELNGLTNRVYQAVRNLTGEISSARGVSGKVGRPPQSIAQEALKTGRHAALAAPVYGTIYGGMAGIQSAIQNYIEFDKTLTRIQMVSGKSADSMKAFAEAASEAGKKLSVTAKDYADASLIFFQQGGAAMDNAQSLAAAAIQLSNATGQAMGDSANSITAIMNSFGMLAEEGEKTGERISDVLLKLDQTTASSGAEISDALTRFAAVAAEAGFSYEEAAAQVATISSATRLSAETIGTALKTFYANLQEVQDAGPEAVEKFTSDLQKVADKYKLNIQPFGPEGELKSGKEILDQIAEAYATMTSNTERQDLVATIAGKHQITQVQALLSNWNIYEQNLTNAQNAQGATNEAQAIYAQSIQAHLNEMANAWEHFTHSIMESESFKVIIDFLTKMIQLLEIAIGGQGGLLKLTGLLTSIMVILNVDKITKFWNAMNSGAIFQTTQQMKLNALIEQQIILEKKLEKAKAEGKGQILEKRLQENLAEQEALKSGKTTGRLGSALKGGGIAAGLAGGIGILSDMSAGKSFGEAAVGNIGNVVGGAAGGAIGSAFGPIGTAIGGMIGAQIGDVINKSILDAAQRTEKAIAAYAATQAEKYKENKQNIHAILVEFEYLNKQSKDQEYSSRRINELKRQLKTLLPDITNLESLTVDQLKEQIKLQEYYLKLQSKNDLKEQLKAAKQQMNDLKDSSIITYIKVKSIQDSIAALIRGLFGIPLGPVEFTAEQDLEERTKKAEEYKKTIEELTKDGKNLNDEESKKLTEAKAGLLEYEAYLKAYKASQQEVMKLTLANSDVFIGLTEDQLNAAVDYLINAKYTANEITKIFSEQGDAYNELLPKIQAVTNAQQKSVDAIEEQRAAINEMQTTFGKLSEDKQLIELQEQFEKLGIPPSVIDDLKADGSSLIEIMSRLTDKIFAHGMIQSLALIPMDPVKKLDLIRPYAATLGINVPTVDAKLNAVFGGYAGTEGIIAGSADEAVQRVLDQNKEGILRTNYQDLFNTNTYQPPVKMAEGGDPYAGAEFLIKQYDKQIELLKKEDQTLDTVSELATKSQQKAAKLTNIINIANAEKAKALKVLGLGANASPEQIAAKISEIQTKIASGGMTEETAKILKDAISDVTTAMEKASDATDKFNETLQGVIDSFKKIEAVPGLDKLIEANEQSADSFTKYQDTMLTGAEKTLAFTDLQKEIKDALSETSDSYSREKLLAYEKELNDLMASGADVSSARVQYLLKQVGVIKERIRLEKESNAENKMMLVRQAGGGFTYQFKRNLGASTTPTTEETDTELAANAQDFFIQSRNAVINAAKNLSEDTKTLLGDKAVEILDKIKKGIPIEDALKGITLTDAERETVTNDLTLFASAVSDTKLGFEGFKDVLPTNELGTFKNQMDQTNTLMTTINTGFKNFSNIFNPDIKGSPANALKNALSTLSSSIKTFIPPKSDAGGGEGNTEQKQKPPLTTLTFEGDKSKLNTSTSIVDYLKSKNYDSSLEARKKLYDFYYDDEYKASAEQNTTLLAKLKAEGYATGGYTGDTPGARPAVLHEKELVLNKMDTRNILAAVAQIRSMPQFAAASPGQIASSGGGSQNVVINANFPNVSSADEIKRAFASMSNNALQFNTRNKVIGAGIK